jgi:ATP synthase subunit 6
MFNSFFISPLEQFEIYPVISIYLGNIDFSLTNHTVFLFFAFFCISTFFFYTTNDKNKSLLIIPGNWQSCLELIYLSVLKLVFGNIPKKEGQYFFPFVSNIFFFILCLNLTGLFPYHSTLTAQLIVVFTIALVVFLGINIVCVEIHRISFFALFLPAGSEGALALILIPIEFISFLFKPISLSLRLFANMMAGHALLKIVAGVCWSLAGCTSILFLMQCFPIALLIFLFALELIVTFIQALVLNFNRS